MSKKPHAGLKIHLLIEHRQASDSIYTESTTLEVHANLNRAVQRKKEMEEELLAMDFSDESYTEDFVQYEVDSRTVEGICQ